MKNVLIVTPVRGGSTTIQYMVGLMHISGLYKGWMPMAGQSDIYVARNVLVNTFYRDPQFDTLVCIDSDIGFTREQFEALVDSPAAFVSGMYPNKSPNPVWLFIPEHSSTPTVKDTPASGLMKARGFGLGFVKIERQMLDAIVEAKLVPTFSNGQSHQFFNGRIEDEHLLSEDYSFCLTARQAGIQPYVNCGISLEHDGRKLR